MGWGWVGWGGCSQTSILCGLHPPQGGVASGGATSNSRYNNPTTPACRSTSLFDTSSSNQQPAATTPLHSTSLSLCLPPASSSTLSLSTISRNRRRVHHASTHDCSAPVSGSRCMNCTPGPAPTACSARSTTCHNNRWWVWCCGRGNGFTERGREERRERVRDSERFPIQHNTMGTSQRRTPLACRCLVTPSTHIAQYLAQTTSKTG